MGSLADEQGRAVVAQDNQAVYTNLPQYMKPQGVSIVICCHNGADRIAETIRHIARQHVPPHIRWEVLVVDNASTDGAADVARKEWQKSRLNIDLRIVDEPTLGLSYARARGFDSATYDFIIMCDDDNWLDQNYVRYAHDIMSDNNNIGALGGFGTLAFEIEPEVEGMSFIFAAGKQAPHTGRVAENRVYGAGCVIRYSAYDKLLKSGFRSLLTDRQGRELSSGGDYELCYALAILGFDVWYDDRLRFVHFITRERLTRQYFVRYARESSKCFNVLSSYKAVAANLRISWAPTLVLLRNFLYCSKIFFSIKLRRLLPTREAEACTLNFRHIEFHYRWVAYLGNFKGMVDTHRIVLNFRERCRPLQHSLRPLGAKAFRPSLRLSFFSKPSRPLQ
jgi:glycosyltransferase involved in cell wall biosynthesis